MDIRSINQRDPYAIAQNTQVERTGERVESRQAQSAGAPKSDTVSFSEEGALRTEAYRTAMSTSDIRQNKVNEIKDRIASGNYQIDSHRIAASLVNQEAAMLN